MNTSAPVTDFLSQVSYGFLSNDDIKRLSARKIDSAVTLDTLLNPVPGGLYTSELGQFGDNLCSTCGLRTPQCPGHCGHIELPVPVFHPTFLDQVLRLLRATCVYCNKLRLSKLEVNRFICKLRLLTRGLVEEAAQLDDIDAAEEDEDDEEDDTRLSDARFSFVNKAIRRADELDTHNPKSETVASARRAVVQEFMAAMTKSTKCGKCKGVAHRYRKDKFVKIFRKPISEKHRDAMIQLGLKMREAVVENAKRKHSGREHPRKRQRQQSIDEGIADMEEEDPSEEEGEDLIDEQVEIAGGVDEAVEDNTARETYLNPSRCLALLNELFLFEQPILSLIYGKKRGGPDLTADMFFIHNVLVPPNRYRPEARQGKQDEIAESPDNSLYKNVINAAEALTDIQRDLKAIAAGKTPLRARTYGGFENAWITMQDAVNSVIDRDRNPLAGLAKQNPEGVKQRLEKKDGLFRKNMMGKRVNFAARTVISPDPNIETNEIGVPPVFALKLTYPEPVTMHNLEELQEAVRNGPRLWPGASAIENEAGQIVSLDRKTADERTALANQLLAPSPSASTRGTRPKKVYRHLNNGDIVIMNRQPTLHKPSMMCHRVRVLPGEKTLRMHYANCNTYNADFDGDEMNLHFPQNEIARAEALSIADTDHQYLSATAGAPLRGLIQDHISICVVLTSRDCFFTRSEYMQLLYAALRPENGHCTSASGRLESMPPAVMKPRKLWTGKQVISTLLKNIMPGDSHSQGLTLESKSKTAAKLWSQQFKEEENVLFQRGELLQGILDKKQIGPSEGGFVHGIYEVYGHTVAGRLLSVLGRLLTKLLHMRAHSCGVADLIFTRQGEEARRDVLKDSDGLGVTVASQYVTLDQANDSQELKRRLEEVLRDGDKQAGLDDRMKGALAKLSGAVTSNCLPNGLVKPFPRNQMQLMTGTGAKGTDVNANQISCNLGQQVLEGRRVPVMVSGKTLPCFKPFDSSARAGGYIVDRFLTGVRPQEYYFHAMAGREGLIDTAVKTSRSGYLQRCLIKGMEGLKVQHDTSVRDSDGTVIQFLYGEDGLDVAKANFLDRLSFSAQNFLSITQSLDMGDGDGWARLMSTEARDAVKAAERRYRKSKSNDLAASDPAISVYNPAQHAGAISERMHDVLRTFMEANPGQLLHDKKNKDEPRSQPGINKKHFQAIIELRYLRALAEAGEAVGVVAGQSVGEPSTQMTLNTFHLAGVSGKNVTLGIPRLRELVMTAAANIKTPMMTLQLTISEDEAKKFAKGISRISLAQLLDKVSVKESTGPGRGYSSAKIYEVSLEFFPKGEYLQEYAITKDDVVATLEQRFLARLQKLVRTELKKKGDEKSLRGKTDALPDIGESAGTIQQQSGFGAEEGESDDDDGDAATNNARQNRRQGGYDDLADEEELALAGRDDDPAADDEPDDPVNDEAYHSQESDSESNDDRELKRSNAARLEERIRTDKDTADITSFKFSGDVCVFTLEYDAQTAKILMLNLVEQAARSSLVQSVPGIASAEFNSEASKAGKNPIVTTEGSNIRAMWDYQHIVHPDHLYTNSVHEILTTYGVEAARTAIHREIAGVFASHAISVNSRHITLIADYMTRGGGYTPFNRNGYRSNASPFMKMSFETTVGFLRDAVLEGDYDDLSNPSARLVVGRTNNVGTGGFDVFYHLKKGTDDADVMVE